MNAFLALLPIILALLLMTKFHLAPGKSLLLALLLAAAIGGIFWQISLLQLTAATLLGLLKSLDIILIIYGAILLLNMLQATGALRSINLSIGFLSKDRRIQVLIIAWMFSNFIEGAAGFGAAPALAAPLLVGLGFPLLPALMVSLVCNSLAVPFGAVGTPVITTFSSLHNTLLQQNLDPAVFQNEMLNRLTAISTLSGIFLPFVAVAAMIFLSREKQKAWTILEILPLSLTAGALFFFPWRLSALWFGPELPSILGTAIGLPLFLLLLQCRFLTPKRTWDFPENLANQVPASPQNDLLPQIPPWKAWLPYACIAILLVLTRLPMLPCKNWFASISTIRLPEILGVPGTSFRWTVLNNPGLFPFLLIAILAAPCFHLHRQQMAGLFRSSAKQVGLSSLAIASSFALVQIMIISQDNPLQQPGMLLAIAQGATKLLGHSFRCFSPVLGTFGTLFSGSCTVSNLLFCGIQFNTAHLLGQSESLLVALQNLGGGIGSMLRLSGIVAACATVNAKGLEGKLLLLNAIPAAIMLLLALLATLLLGY